MKVKPCLFIILILIPSTFFAQRLPNGRPFEPHRPRGNRQPRPDRNIENGNSPEWFKLIDVNSNGKIEAEEFNVAATAFFKDHDKNQNAVLEQQELPRKHGEKPMMLPPKEVPPFLFLERGQFNMNQSEFADASRQKFNSADQNKDGALDLKEIKEIRPPHQNPNPPKESSPTAVFLGAEMRFGDKLIKDAPFSAEILIENTRRLFDGSTVTKQTNGAFYRDTSGRTRREQTIDSIGGFSIGETQKLVFINDFPAKTHYFIDLNRKIVRLHPIPENRSPVSDAEPRNAKTELLGTKTLEGVKVDGTRTTIDIPIGQIGNDKPLQVITEKWFSPELQTIVMSKLTDPVAGEQTFRLVNIKISEPSNELFVAPKDFRFEKE